jgi:hypothetical protein
VLKKYNIIIVALDMKTITCPEAGFDNDYIVKGETEEEVLKKGSTCHQRPWYERRGYHYKIQRKSKSNYSHHFFVTHINEPAVVAISIRNSDYDVRMKLTVRKYQYLYENVSSENE